MTTTECSWAHLFAICCTTDVSAEVKDRFMKASINFPGDEDQYIAFVDSMTEITRNDFMGHNTSSSSSTSPFQGKDAYECYLLLRQLRTETESIVEQAVFAILDERSLQDDTVVLVTVDEEESPEKPTSARCEFSLARAKLMQYFIGDADIDEDLEEAEEDGDGVLREPSEFISHEDDDTHDAIHATSVEKVHGEAAAQGYKLHEPDPKDFFPPDQRREFLLDDGSRVIVASRDMEKSWKDEIFFIGGKPARVVRELIGMEKSPAFRPVETATENEVEVSQQA